jgi:hypothetical protein
VRRLTLRLAAQIAHRELASTSYISGTSDFMTFVLGAGSSCEASTATGGYLKEKIASSMAFTSDIYGHMARGDNQIRVSLYEFRDLT